MFIQKLEEQMFMRKFEEQAYALFRIMTGFLFIWHGTEKLFDFPKPAGWEPPWHIMYIAAPMEMIGGAMIMLGLFTRHTAFLLSGLMAAAYWMVHGLNDFWPLNNGGERAAFYCFAFLFIATRGAGIWSADDMMKK